LYESEFIGVLLCLMKINQLFKDTDTQQDAFRKNQVFKFSSLQISKSSKWFAVSVIKLGHSPLTENTAPLMLRDVTFEDTTLSPSRMSIGPLAAA
jgi:hypothetical protein